MIELGRILSEGSGASVFKDARGYFYITEEPVISLSEIDDSYPDEEFVPRESAIFLYRGA
jgi:hypothetical protein